MRAIVAATVLLALWACGRAEAPPPPLSPRPAQPWFICDGIDAPYVVAAYGGPNSDAATLDVFAKSSGEIAGRHTYSTVSREGAAGSLYYTLRAASGATAVVRVANADMLETPASAYTPPVTSVRWGLADEGESGAAATLESHNAECRWLPRTRMIGFTSRRSFVVHEDADGDLIYTSYDFADAGQLAPIELSENGRTTPFSAEARGGQELVAPDGAEFRFASGAVAYVVRIGEDGAARLDVERAGAVVQSEPVAAYALGSGES